MGSSSSFASPELCDLGQVTKHLSLSFLICEMGVLLQPSAGEVSSGSREIMRVAGPAPSECSVSHGSDRGDCALLLKMKSESRSVVSDSL